MNEQYNSILSLPYIQININIWVVYLFFIIFLFFILIVVLKITRWFIRRKQHFKQTIFLVKFPRDEHEDGRNDDFTIEKLKEEISKGESLFSSIGGLRAQHGIRRWLFGRDDNFSFEIVANNKRIAFYVISPSKMSRYIEQHIHAYYPDAYIEESSDYNIFNKNGVVLINYFKTKNDFILPIKTYTKMEHDPMNSIVNTMSKMDNNEGISLQLMVRSASPNWHKRISTFTRYLGKGKSVKEAILLISRNKTFGFFIDIIKFAKPPVEGGEHINESMEKMTSMQEEMIKNIEEKNSKAGLDVNLRVVVSTKDKFRAKSYISNISNALNEYNYYEYGNKFSAPMSSIFKLKMIKDFIHRRFSEKESFLLNTEELTSIFHFPLRQLETPNILWLEAKSAPAPSNMSKNGICLGENTYRGIKNKIIMKKEDRRRHTYILGKSGGGKSVLLAGMAIQDIINGDGVGILDPHGDLIDDVIKKIPPERAEDVILFAPYDTERPLGLNLLEYDKRYPEQKTFMINEVINIFDKLYDLKSTGGPMFEYYMRNALLLIMDDPESGSTLMEVPKVLADEGFRKMKLSKCKDQTVVDFWEKEAQKAGGDAALANIVPYITSKLTQFISNDLMRPIIGQQKSSFNVRDAMNSQKILLIDLSKGKIGETNGSLLGLILIGKILISALSRSDMEPEKRKDFYLYIDEFQNYITDSISAILSEARKYGLDLIMAHQYIGQLTINGDTSVRDAVFGNVGTIMSFRTGADDAEFLEKEFAPVFNQHDLINAEGHSIYTKLLIDNVASRPFTMVAQYPLPGKDYGIDDKIRQISRLKYGKDRKIVDSEILNRIKGI